VQLPGGGWAGGAVGGGWGGGQRQIILPRRDIRLQVIRPRPRIFVEVIDW